ncbi:MAG: UDP-N-acetylmuramoyl-L-alanyl-D-glutamate--2,6-diaminopimelate ligase [Porticoccaceae bacterium]|nr:UDP-N-acetylmuramoyl-L-alanyl-D-glutamate--2,6-diaminopimelate ligase [Porticoccaceae bacterium]
MMALSHSSAITLVDLLKDLMDTSDCPAISVTGVALDSRLVVSGDVFIAVKGTQTDGSQYMTQAVEKGAVAVLLEQGVSYSDCAVPVIAVPDLSEYVSDIAGVFYGQPSQQMPVTAITGTNGKTTCSQLLAQLFDLLGEPAGFIGTLGYGISGYGPSGSELNDSEPNATDTGLTTPDAVSVQRILAELQDAGAKRIAMEVSSHSLVQRRVAGLQVDTAVFTNLTRDHLDYHGDLNSYAAAKARLFAMAGLKNAVINLDDNVGRLILANIDPLVNGISYSVENHSADIHCDQISISASGIVAEVVTPWGRGQLKSSLLGKFNLANLLAVIGAAGVQGFALNKILQAAASLTAVSGRMELVDASARPAVVIDYAHTPDALEKALLALRNHCQGKLWVVFGCGGDRDIGKRAEMGKVADHRADKIVVTSDNPRGESPEKIIDQVLLGIKRDVSVVVDRRDAIRTAIKDAQSNDVVLIAGKGHEDYQILGAQRLPFSDQAEARLALRSREGGEQ